MRSVLLIALLVVANIATAHDFKLSLRGSGIYASGTPRNEIYGSTTGTLYNFPALKTTGFSGAVQFRHGGERIEMAYGFEMGSLTGKKSSYGYSFDNQTIHELIVDQNIARTYYLQHVMANVKIPAGKLHPYAGIMAGFIMTDAIGKARVNTYWWPQNVIEFESFKTNGASLGIQGGINWSVTHHLELAGELGARHTWLRETAVSILDDSPKLNYRLLSFNLTAGINYVF